MEEIVFGVLKGLLNLASIVIRFLVWLIVDLWILVIGWYVGWPILRFFTLNIYPTESINDHERASDITGVIVVER
ncbi:MAG: hypothetical protein JKY67_15165 [Pseudomonadales bacterium]|nr:hypothetical protein [Pseudomonadales bacterium]